LIVPKNMPRKRAAAEVPPVTMTTDETRPPLCEIETLTRSR
jgi:hypothetical protein